MFIKALTHTLGFPFLLDFFFVPEYIRVHDCTVYPTIKYILYWLIYEHGYEFPGGCGFVYNFQFEGRSYAVPIPLHASTYIQNAVLSHARD